MFLFLVPTNPTIDKLKPFLTKILITWNEPKVKNGIIKLYEICWLKAKDNIVGPTCQTKSEPDRNFDIENLNPGITYIVTINASTSAGFGPADKKKVETLKSGKLTTL